MVHRTSTRYTERSHGTHNRHTVHRASLFKDDISASLGRHEDISLPGYRNMTQKHKWQHNTPQTPPISGKTNLIYKNSKCILVSQLICRNPAGSTASKRRKALFRLDWTVLSTNTSVFRAFQYFFTHMDSNSTPPWVKIPLRSAHIPAPVYQHNRSTHGSYHSGREPLCHSHVCARTTEQTAPCRAVPCRAFGVTQYRLHCSLLRADFAQLSQMNAAVCWWRDSDTSANEWPC